VPEQELAGLRQGHASRPARPLDKALVDDALEGLDLLADRGLRVAEALGRAAARRLHGDRLERGEMPQLDPQPSISSHD
jgi:hypothetical protein